MPLYLMTCSPEVLRSARAQRSATQRSATRRDANTRTDALVCACAHMRMPAHAPVRARKLVRTLASMHAHMCMPVSARISVFF